MIFRDFPENPIFAKKRDFCDFGDHHDHDLKKMVDFTLGLILATFTVSPLLQKVESTEKWKKGKILIGDFWWIQAKKLKKLKVIFRMKKGSKSDIFGGTPDWGTP